MSKSIYIEQRELNELQKNIMRFIDLWAHEKKTPIPLGEIIAQMKGEGIKDFTTANAVDSLLRKRYIRRAITISNKTTFVQLRRI